jgi:hypothetical protein
MNAKTLTVATTLSALVLLVAACGKGGPAAGAAALPAECEAYVTTVNTCVAKLGGDNPAVAAFKQQMETAKAEWAKISDKATLAPACKQMEDAFKQATAASLKC